MEPHLNDEQIEEILQFASGLQQRQGGDVDHTAGAFAHLNSCEICQAHLEREKASMDLFAQIRPEGIEMRRIGCPPDEKWIEIAGGTMTVEVDTYLDHAAQCDHCGQLLRQSIADFTAELTPQEEIQIETLQSSTVDWQNAMANRLIVTTPKNPERTTSLFRRLLAKDRPARWAYLTLSCAVAVFLAVVVIGIWTNHQPSHSESETDLSAVNNLLIESYGEQRTLSLRFPGAPYAKQSPTRGPSESDLDRPLPLLKAEAAIKAGMQRQPTDPGWLEARAKVDLLKWNFRSAIKSLKEANAASPGSIPIKLDLATAYFESGRVEGGNGYGQSINLLKSVLDQEPNNEIAIFNLAIVCQEDNDFACAKENFQKYLSIDATGNWANEARQHLKEVLGTTDGRSRRDLEQLLSDEQFVADIKRDDEETWRPINLRIEDYLNRALIEWMPNLTASPFTRDGRFSTDREALETLGVILERTHGDHFLIDLLSGIGHQNFAAALESLRRSMLANENGNPGEALTEAQASEAYFKSTENAAGVLRARFEQTYALQFLLSTSRCLKSSSGSFREAVFRRYSWLATQFSLEEAYCSNISGNPGTVRAFARQADEWAIGAHYDDLHLRAMVGIAAIDAESGSTSHAWKVISDGLHSFWSGQGSPTRGYSFYVLLDALADADQLWQFDSTVISEALHFMPLIHDPLVEAAIRYRMAETSIRLGRPNLASDQLRQAQRLLDEAPQSEANSAERMTGTIELAEVEENLGHHMQSIELLQQARAVTEGHYEVFDALEYFRTLGQSRLKLGQLEAAKRSLVSAIEVCEIGAGTLRSPRDRLSWIRACKVPYYSIIEVEFKEGAADQAFATYQRFRQVTMNTLSGFDRSGPIYWKDEIARSSSNDKEKTGPKSRPIGNIWNASQIDGVIVTYVTLDDGLLVWTHDNRGSSVHWVDVHEPELERVVARFLAECEDPDSDRKDLRRDAKILYQWLIAPIRESLGSTNHLTIEPDSPIANTPFEAMIGPDDDFIGEHFSLIISPGGNRVMHRQSIKTLANQPALILDSDYSDTRNGLLPLESTRREVQAISGLLGKPSLLIGSAATQGALENYLPRTVIFHYLGHSQIDLDGNSLLLRTDQQVDSQTPSSVLWGASNISPFLFRRCKLAVLSACSTANGEQGEWLNRESLVFALISAGVPTVIASHWNVDSGSTSVMMEAFYRHLRHEGNASLALQQAQAEVRRMPTTSHPFYWAAFSVFGTP